MPAMPESTEPDIYPALLHFSVIAEASRDISAGLAAALAGRGAGAPPQPGPASRSGRYATFRLSAQCATRGEHASLLAALKNIPGVKMVV